jgi:hypothetical protein
LHHRGRQTTLSLGAWRRSGYLYSPYPVLPPPVTRVTLIQYYVPPPRPLVVIIPPPPELPPAPEPPPPPPLPGDPAGGFRPVGAQERAKARAPVAEKPPEKPAPPAAKKAPLPPPAPFRPPPPAAGPREEAEQLLRLGREAFAAREYGRAALRFGQAAAADPTMSLAPFLLAQAQLALGKYDEAVDAIHAGLRLQPDWPTAGFRPVELYERHVADLPLHLRRLEEARERHPDDPVLLFLSAYQLWLDGRREEARPLFERAAQKAAGPSFAERFLLAAPAGPAF